MTKLNIAFMGTAAFGLPALEAIVAIGHRISCVYTRAPKPAGRGHALRKTPIHEAADGLGIPVRTPASLKDPAEQEAFRALGVDAAVVAAYGLILPKPILEAPRLGCLNIHGSLLPRWRGAAPIERAILAGDDATGITIMRMNKGLDTGPMLLTKKVPIAPHATAAALRADLAAIGARLIVEALNALEMLTPQPQPEDGVTYAKKLTREEERIDWMKPARLIERQVRAIPSWFEAKGERIKLLAATTADAHGAAGTVLDVSKDSGPTIACGDGALRLLKLQRPGRGPVDADAFLRGFALPPGTVLPSA